MGVVAKKFRPGFEPSQSVKSLGWIGQQVECREDAGLYDDRGHFGTVVKAEDRPNAGTGERFRKGEWGWFCFVNEDHPYGITIHSSEVYPPST